MPDLYTDDNGNRVLVRHKGPAGKGFPPGGTTGQIFAKASDDDFDGEWVNPPDGTGAAAGPAESVDGHIVLFDGITGKLLKSSNQTLSHYATVSLVDTKVDKVTGKTLSENDFTDVLKTKLDAIQSTSGYRGSFANLAAINSETFSPLPIAGDYCLIEAASTAPQKVLWDATNNVWSVQFPDAVDMTGEEIAAVLFDEDDTWAQEGCRIFTEAEKAQLAAHEALINSLGGLITDEIPQGSISYFDLIGTAVAITDISTDGISHLVKVNVVTALAGDAQNFDNGGASNGRLRYTGAQTRKFVVSANVSYSGAAHDVMVMALYKNGSAILPSKIVHSTDNTGVPACVTLVAIVQLSLNEYIEVFLGNTTTTDDPTIHTLSITASAI